MKDIFDIKWNLYISLITSDWLIYFFELLVLFLVVFLLSFLVDKLVKFIKKLKAKRLEKMLLKKKYIEIISNLESKDKDFLKKLSFNVRDYFEKAKIFEKPTKKTATELKTWKDKILDDFFINCRDLEFSKENNNKEILQKLQSEAIKIIQNNFL